jgi:hypothetical protein
MARPRLPLLLVLAAATTILAGTAAPAAHARKVPRAPRSFVGVVSDDALWGTSFDPSRARTMGAIRRMGAGAVRAAFLWDQIETRPGRYDFGMYDGFMAQAATFRLAVLPVLFEPPSFRSGAPAHGAARGTYPPASNAEFAHFASALVHRYGPRGVFWRERPGLPRMPIHAWQIWNEPNLRQYWPTGPNPAAYTAMLRAVGPAIRRADRHAEVVTAGIPDSPTGIPLGRFVRGMYRAGARGTFTSLGLQPYAPTPAGVLRNIRGACAIMRRNRDRAGVRVTEIGWATGGPGRKPVSERAQARMVGRTVALLVRQRRSLRLTGVTLFNWRDTAPYPGGHDFWGLHAGLLAENGRAKPVVSTLASVLRRVVRP